MRTSLLMGLFACAVIFTVGSNSASATTLSSNELIISNQTIERIVEVSETSKSPLLLMATDLATTEEVIEPLPVVPAVVKHVVIDNENLSKIAEIHNTSWKRIYDKNTTLVNPDTITVGQEIIIPAIDEVLEERVIEVPQEVVKPEIESTRIARNKPAVANQQKPATKKSAPASSSGNGYVAGYCTWYVKNRRPDLPNNLGNASTWVSRASSQGLATGSTPAVGAVGQSGNHVVYVESVNGDGTVTISDMNWSGLYKITTRTVPASNFSYIY